MTVELRGDSGVVRAQFVGLFGHEDLGRGPDRCASLDSAVTLCCWTLRAEMGVVNLSLTLFLLNTVYDHCPRGGGEEGIERSGFRQR